MTEEEIRLNALDYCNKTKEYGETMVERHTKQLAYMAGARDVNKEVEALHAEIEKLRNQLISANAVFDDKIVAEIKAENEKGE